MSTELFEGAGIQVTRYAGRDGPRIQIDNNTDPWRDPQEGAFVNMSLTQWNALVDWLWAAHASGDPRPGFMHG